MRSLSSTSYRPSAQWVLGGVLILALLLRGVNITWGVPLDPYTGYYHPDESKIVTGAIKFPGDVLERNDLRYPTGLHYTVGVITAPARWALGAAGSSADPYLFTFMVARTLTLVLGVLAVAAVYFLGRRWYGAPAALVGAAFLAVMSVNVIHGALATLDGATSFLAVLALWRCDELVRRPGRRNTILLGAASGLLIGTKWPGATVLAPAAVALFVAYAWNPLKSEPAAAIDGSSTPPANPDRSTVTCVGTLVRESALYAAATLVVVLLTTPSILVRPEALLGAIQYESGRQGLLRFEHLQPRFAIDAIGSIGDSAGIWVALLVALAALYALVRPTYREALLLAFLVPFYLVLGDRADQRYLIMVTPIFCLLVSRLHRDATALPHRLWRRLANLAFALVWITAFAYTLQSLQLRHQSDARSAASRYLHETAQPGSTVCTLQPSESSPQRWKDIRLRDGELHRVACDVRPDFVVVIGGGDGRMAEALASPLLDSEYRWDPSAADWWPDSRVPSAETLLLFESLLDGLDGRRDYDLVADYQNQEHSVAPFLVSSVRVYLHVDSQPTFEMPRAPDHIVDARIGETFVLRGYDLDDRRSDPDGSVYVTLYWQALGEAARNYTVFVHALDGDGALVAQHDGAPGGGRRPTSGWTAGEVVVDRHVLHLDGAPPGSQIELSAGLYDASDLSRLPTFSAEGRRLPDDRVPLNIVTSESPNDETSAETDGRE